MGNEMKVLDGIRLDLPASINAAIYFVKDYGQCVFHWRDDSGNSMNKFISSADARAAFLNEPIDSGWLDPRVRKWGRSPKGDWFVAVIPPAIRTISVETAKAPEKKLDVPFPTLLFMGVGTTYYVWALQGEFSKDATVFRAPLPNVGDDGKICWGSNSASKADAADISPMWDIFLASTFNNHSIGGKSNKHEDDIRHLLVKLHESKSTVYPVEDMCKIRGWRNDVDQVVFDTLEG